MKKYIFSSKKIFKQKISAIFILPITFIIVFLLLIFLTMIPKVVFFELFLALSVIVSIILSLLFFVMYMAFEPETPRFVKIDDYKIEIVSPGRKMEYLIKDIDKIEYNHRKGYIHIFLKNGELKSEPYIRVVDFQRDDFENEIRRINEKRCKK